MSYSAEKFRGGTSLCCVPEKFRPRKRSGMKGEGGGGLSRFSVILFLSHNAELFRRGTFLCCVSDNFRLRERLWMKGGYEDFPSKVFFVSECRKFP